MKSEFEISQIILLSLAAWLGG